MPLFNTATPMVYALGVEDLSSRELLPEPSEYPQHMPLCMFFAKKGTTKKQPMNGSKMVSTYDMESFDKNNPYYTHATAMASIFADNGNWIMGQRVVPSDAPAPAKVTFYVDIVEADLPKYPRNSDGTIPTGVASSGTVSGYRVKHIIANDDAPGIKQGTMTEGGTASTMYPIYTRTATEKGKWYDNIGHGLSVPSTDEVSSSEVENNLAFPYQLFVYENKDGTHVPVKSLYGETGIDFSLKVGSTSIITDESIHLADIFEDKYSNETDVNLTLRPSNEELEIHQSSINTLVKLLANKESSMVSDTLETWEDGDTAATYDWYDFTTSDADTIKTDETHLMNFITLKTLSGAPYYGAAFDDSAPTLTTDQKESRASKRTPFFLSGGGDGTLSLEMLEEQVGLILDKYIDGDSEVIDTAINPESIFYDSGFSQDIKDKIGNFIGVRKDTQVVVGTYVVSEDNTIMNIADERAVANMIRTKLKMFAESTHFGTPAFRGAIIAGSGEIIDKRINNRLPLTFEVANKMSKYMGASNFKWKSGSSFDSGVGANITLLKNIEPNFIPQGIKPALWTSEMNWPQPIGINRYHFASLQTVYGDDTSILNGIETMVAIGSLEKIGIETWRNFTGNNSLSEAQFKDAVEGFVNERVKGIFDNKYVVVPEVIFTASDKARGYSWTLVNKIYGNNKKTVMTYSIESRRLSELLG